MCPSDETWSTKAVTKVKTQYKAFKRTIYGNWTSRQAPGTPAIYEALFEMIDNGQTETAAFRFARKYFKLTDDEMWKAYEEWKSGKLPEILRGKSEI